MNDPFANSGFLVLTGTDAFDLSRNPIQGFTPVGGPAVVSTITLPAQRAGTGYRGDASHLTGLSLAEGVFYPIPATAVTLSNGTLIAWRD